MIRRGLTKLARLIRRADPPFASRVFPVLRDVRHPRSARGRALLTYLCEPFLDDPGAGSFRHHANRRRSLAIADELAARGLKVDVTDWRNPSPPDSSNYDLIVGLGAAFSAACLQRRPHAASLYLATGAAPEQTNEALRHRAEEFRKRHGRPIRVALLEKDAGPALADRLLLIGNDWTMSTYGRYSTAPVDRGCNAVTQGIDSPRSGKDFSEARHHFLWMAAYGALRRRLDLVLEAFALRPELHLWICGGVEHEREFCSVMSQWLDRTSNIHRLGWMDVGSEAFVEVATRCGYLLYPSVSDGMPGSVVNSGACGIVPLVTREAGIDVQPFGFEICGSTMDEVSEAIDFASSVSAAELSERSRLAAEHMRSRYSEREFQAVFAQSLDALGIESREF